MQSLDSRLQDRVLAHGHTSLRGTLDLKAVFPHLNAQGLLTVEQRDYLLNELHTRHDKIDHFVQWIPQKGRDALYRLIVCLEASRDDALGHRELATLLENFAYEEIDCIPRPKPKPIIPADDPHRSSELCFRQRDNYTKEGSVETTFIHTHDVHLGQGHHIMGLYNLFVCV